jgi:hypothetical protein
MALDQVQGVQEGIGPRGPGSIGFEAAGKYGQLLTSDLFGKFGDLCMRGYVYAATGAAAAAVPIATTLTNSPTLWNPASSSKLVIPLRILLSLGAVGTPILQGFTISYLTGAGDGIGTGAPVVTFTNIAPVCLLLGKGTSASTKFAGAVCTFTTQPARIMDLGFGHLLEGAAASGQLYSQFYHDFDGSLQMPPGTTISLGSTIATSTTYWTTIIFAEIPMPAQLP